MGKEGDRGALNSSSNKLMHKVSLTRLEPEKYLPFKQNYVFIKLAKISADASLFATQTKLVCARIFTKIVLVLVTAYLMS